MILILISYIAVLAFLRIINYILYILNLSHLFLHVLLSIFFICYIIIRLLFFFSPFEITLEGIIKKREEWDLKKNNKYYYILLKICYIFGGKSYKYYDDYFSRLFVKWQISRYYFQENSFLTFLLEVNQYMMDELHIKFKYILSFLYMFFFQEKPQIDPEDTKERELTPLEIYFNRPEFAQYSPQERLNFYVFGPPEPIDYEILGEIERKIGWKKPEPLPEKPEDQLLDPEKPGYFYRVTKIENEYLASQQKRFSVYYSKFRYLVLHYSLIILWFCPIKDQGIFYKWSYLLLQFKLKILDIFFIKYMPLMELPTSIETPMSILKDRITYEVYSLQYPRITVERLLFDIGDDLEDVEQYYQDFHYASVMYKAPNILDTPFHRPSNGIFEIQAEFGNWVWQDIYHELYEELGEDIVDWTLFEMGDFDDYPEFLYFNDDETLMEELYHDEDFTEGLVETYRESIYENAEYIRRLDGIAPYNSYVINMDAVFLSYGWSLLIGFSILLLSRRLQFLALAYNKTFVSILVMVSIPYFMNFIPVEIMVHLLSYLLVHTLHLDFIYDYYVQMRLDYGTSYKYFEYLRNKYNIDI